MRKTSIHAIPHCLDQEGLAEELAKVRIDREVEHNILMLHGAVAGIPEFSMGELSEQEIPTSYFDLGFDYVALGHYHRHCEVEPHAFYAGSTERLSLSELGQKKGFLEIDTGRAKPVFHPVPTREMIELPLLDVKDLDQDQVYLEIENRIKTADITDKIVRLKVGNIPQHVYNSLDFRRITELKSQAFHLDLKFEKKEEKEKAPAAETTIHKLPLEFRQYLKQAVVENLNKDRLLELGLKYLSEQTMAEGE